jgi:hypothetical protein
VRCQRCQVQDALEKNGVPALLRLFEEIDGYFCAPCVLELQRPYNAQLRRLIAERAASLTEADLAAVPDQMLKFTMCLPIQAGPGGPPVAPSPADWPRRIGIG